MKPCSRFVSDLPRPIGYRSHSGVFEMTIKRKEAKSAGFSFPELRSLVLVMAFARSLIEAPFVIDGSLFSSFEEINELQSFVLRFHGCEAEEKPSLTELAVRNSEQSVQRVEPRPGVKVEVVEAEPADAAEVKENEEAKTPADPFDGYYNNFVNGRPVYVYSEVAKLDNAINFSGSWEKYDEERLTMLYNPRSRVITFNGIFAGLDIDKRCSKLAFPMAFHHEAGCEVFGVVAPVKGQEDVSLEGLTGKELLAGTYPGLIAYGSFLPNYLLLEWGIYCTEKGQETPLIDVNSAAIEHDLELDYPPGSFPRGDVRLEFFGV